MFILRDDVAEVAGRGERADDRKRELEHVRSLGRKAKK